MRCSECIEGTSERACQACREMQHTGRWLWELDNGQRICRCPDCGFGNLIGLYKYRNPYNYCASCGHLMIPQEQTRMEG